MEKEYQVENRQTLLDALQIIYPDCSKSTLRSFIKHRTVLVDGEIALIATEEIVPGQRIRIVQGAKEVGHGIKILYEDRYLVVIDKPVGLLSVPLDTEDGVKANALDSLNDFFHTTHIYAVHRLDKEVSGVMIFARGKRSASLLSALFKDHDLTRVYSAVVQGNVKEDRGKWESNLLEAKSFKVYASPEGQRAVTHFEVVRRTKEFTFLYLTLETGKKHQIRVHCKDAGHPIAGDKFYGNKECNPISRICLHSTRLELVHPFTGKKMQFSAPLPSSFAKLVNFSF